MNHTPPNFRHLYYFWVVAKEGSITRAAERLGLAIQTVSTQLAQLEMSFGKSLFTQQGRRLTLTEAGRLALSYADQIFLLGEQMQEALAESDSARTRLTVGISDSLPKLTAYRLLEIATAAAAGAPGLLRRRVRGAAGRPRWSRCRSAGG